MEFEEQNDNPGAGGQVPQALPGRQGRRSDGILGTKGHQRQLLSREVIQSVHLEVSIAAGVAAMDEGKQVLRAKRKGARRRMMGGGGTQGMFWR